MNVLNIILPYRLPDAPDVWVFDDDSRGLLREPFVGQANELLSYADRKLQSDGRLIVFFREGISLPEASHCVKASLRLIEATDNAGTTYSATLDDGTVFRNVWLCPAFLKFFDVAPRQFDAMVTPRENPFRE